MLNMKNDPWRKNDGFLKRCKITLKQTLNRAVSHGCKPLNMTRTYTTAVKNRPHPSHITKTPLPSVKWPVKTPPGEEWTVPASSYWSAFKGVERVVPKGSKVQAIYPRRIWAESTLISLQKQHSVSLVYLFITEEWVNVGCFSATIFTISFHLNSTSLSCRGRNLGGEL